MMHLTMHYLGIWEFGDLGILLFEEYRVVWK
jgi:hypothetical protein